MAPNRALIGLLLVLAFIGHDVLMAAPSAGLAAEPPSPALTRETSEPQALSPHPHGCEIGQTAALRTPETPGGQPLVSAIVVQPVRSRPVALSAAPDATRARSSSQLRAVLQVFRI